MTTPNYLWPLPNGTNKPDVVEWISLLGDSVDSTLKAVDDYGKETRVVANDAIAIANSAANDANTADAKAVAAQNTANQAKATADAALPKADRPRGDTIVRDTGTFGAFYVAFPPGAFTKAPIVTVTPQTNMASAGIPSQIYIGDGGAVAAPTKDGFWVAGFPTNSLARIMWIAIPAP